MLHAHKEESFEMPNSDLEDENDCDGEGESDKVVEKEDGDAQKLMLSAFGLLCDEDGFHEGVPVVLKDAVDIEDNWDPHMVIKYNNNID